MDAKSLESQKQLLKKAVPGRVVFLDKDGSVKLAIQHKLAIDIFNHGRSSIESMVKNLRTWYEWEESDGEKVKKFSMRTIDIPSIPKQDALAWAVYQPVGNDAEIMPAVQFFALASWLSLVPAEYNQPMTDKMLQAEIDKLNKTPEAAAAKKPVLPTF